jgi:hypothetical protein
VPAPSARSLSYDLIRSPEKRGAEQQGRENPLAGIDESSSPERPPFEVCSFCNASSGSLPADSRSSGGTWTADDGSWGPCGIRLGSTEVGKVGMIHQQQRQDEVPRPSCPRVVEASHPSGLVSPR